jgi:hypothetical protein
MYLLTGTMHDASPPRPRLFVSVAAFLVASAFASAVALAGDAEPPYFSERFGGRIERVAVGPDGTIYVAGIAKAADLPASTSAPVPGGDANGPYWLYFAAALEPDGSPRWTSYARGLVREGYLSVRGLAVAPDGSVWIAGNGVVDPVAAFQPVAGSDQDAIVAKFAADGTLLFASNLGGKFWDEVTGLALDPDGDAILVGTTQSPDFAPAPLPPDGASAPVDAFVARLHGDGSGIAWARRFGSDVQGGRFDGGGVAVDPVDATIVVAMAGAPNQARGPFATGLSPPRTDPPVRVFPWDMGPLVIRLDPGGVQTEGARLHGLGSAWTGYPLPVLIGADRSVLAGGVYGVARTTPELFLAMTDVWVRRGRARDAAAVSRICTAGSGRVVIAARRFSDPASTDIVVLDASLAEDEAPVERTAELGFAAADIAVDADGSLLAVGTGNAASFHAPYETPGPAAGCIARVPLDGIRAPTRLRARVAGTRDVDLVWSRDGDRADGYDIERVGYGAAPLLVGHVAGDVFRFRATGLAPGAGHGLRVVSVLPSGVRSASPVRWVVTPPEPPLEVVATDGPGRTIDVRWTDVNGVGVRWGIQRRFGDGEWMSLHEPGPGDTVQSPAGVEPRVIARTDVVPDVTVPVRYRVHAYLLTESRVLWSGSTESAPIVPASVLRVNQTRGRFVAWSPQGAEFVVEGTFAPVDGAGPVSFDPATQDFRLLYGYANEPGVLALPRGYPGWTVADGVARWRAADSLAGWDDRSEVRLDLVHGTFLVRFLSSYWPQGNRIRSIAVNLEVGPYSGGDVREWRGAIARTAPLWFDVAAPRAKGARTR